MKRSRVYGMIGYIYTVSFNINSWARGTHEIHKNWTNTNCKDSISSFLWLIWCTGARIDHGHHDSKAKVALSETLMLDEAVRVATDMTDEHDTLMIVTADHSHVFNIAGYPKRGNDILG